MKYHTITEDICADGKEHEWEFLRMYIGCEDERCAKCGTIRHFRFNQELRKWEQCVNLQGDALLTIPTLFTERRVRRARKSEKVS